MFEWLQAQFQGNEIFGGVVGAAVIGATWMTLRSWGLKLVTLIVSQFIITITIRSEDDVFSKCQDWFESTPYMQKRCRRVQFVSGYEVGENKRSMVAPAEGRHWVIYRGKLVRVDRKVTTKETSWSIKESFVITCFGRDRAIIKAFLSDITHVTHENMINIYTWSGWWRKQRRRRGRCRDTLFLNAGVADEVFRDVEWFLGAQEYYAERGIPYHRGYLFEGPPGTGKTTLAVALATTFKLTVRCMNLNSFGGDKELTDSIVTAGPGSLILIEDVDAAQSSKKRKPKPEIKSTSGTEEPKADGDESTDNVTTSGLLNALDGVIYPEGSIFVMTTNHPEKLDAALVRSGRVDLSVKLDYPNRETVLRMAAKYFGEVPKWVSTKLNSPGGLLPQSEWQNLFAKAATHTTHEDEEAVNDKHNSSEGRKH